MNKKTLLRLALALLLPLLLAACPLTWNSRKAPPPTEPPRIDCNERAPAELAPAAPKQDSLPLWKAYARRWMGVATAEVQKRVETADCLDRERAAGRIK